MRTKTISTDQNFQLQLTVQTLQLNMFFDKTPKQTFEDKDLLFSLINPP